MTDILTCKNLSFRYKYGDKEVLKDVNLTLAKGDRVALIGRNGMGKSTLFLNLNGVYKPTGGQIFLEGQELGSGKKDLRRLRQKVGLVFQNPDQQFIAPTVEGEISFGLFNLGKKEEEVRAKLEEVAHYLDIVPLLKKSTAALSGGEKKLVSIASVLVMDPEVILFDEPTAGVDLYNRQVFQGVLKKLEDRSIGILMATHDNDFVWEWAQRVLLIHQGQILFDGGTQDFFKREDLLATSKLMKPGLVRCQEILKEKNIYSGPPLRTWEDLEKNL
ncbi:MAG: ABC transporter ATP-binding protein [Tissierellia bacterium]|nr:ABC transporter ATP-binding protein [Tissierellia bacterium]